MYVTIINTEQKLVKSLYLQNIHFGMTVIKFILETPSTTRLYVVYICALRAVLLSML